MYRKYVRKWLFFKRNRIISPDVGLVVNDQFLPGNSNVFVKLPEKFEIFRKFALENRFCFKLPEKITIFRKFAWKNQNFLPGSTTPQISNQIAITAGVYFHFSDSKRALNFASFVGKL